MKYEYQILDVSFPPELTEDINNQTEFGVPLKTELRSKINTILSEQINTMAKKGWKLHESGISTLPALIFYRQIGAKNVR